MSAAKTAIITMITSCETYALIMNVTINLILASHQTVVNTNLISVHITATWL